MVFDFNASPKKTNVTILYSLLSHYLLEGSSKEGPFFRQLFHLGFIDLKLIMTDSIGQKEPQLYIHPFSDLGFLLDTASILSKTSTSTFCWKTTQPMANL